MPLRESGTRLVLADLQTYIGGMNSAIQANARFDQSVKNLGKGGGRDPFAPLVGQANRAATQVEQRFQRLNQTLNRGNQLGGAFLGGAAAFLGVQSAQQIIQSAASLDELRGRAKSTQIALELLAGGSKQATDAIAEIQSVAPGSTDSLTAAEGAITILTQKLPSAAISLKDIAKFAATVPRISASIKDSGDAIAQLTLFSSSNAFARADQLGVTAADVKDRMKELAAVFPELSDAQIKAAATVQLLNERFGPLQDTLAENVTGWTKLKTAITEARIELAKGIVGQAVDATFSGAAGLVTSGVEGAKLVGTGISGIPQAAEIASTRGEVAALENQLRLLQEGRTRLEGDRGTEFFDQAGLDRQNGLIAQTQVLLAGVNSELQIATGNANNLSGGFQSAVDAAAFLPTVVSSISDPLEGFKSTSAEIEDLFSRLNGLGDIPGVDALRNQVIGLATEVALTGGTTDETEAKLIELNNAINNLNAGGAIGELIALTNAEIGARQEAQALAGAIAGIGGRVTSGISGLIGRGLVNEQQANRLQAAIQPQVDAAAAQFQSRGLRGPELQFAVAATERVLLAPLNQIAEADQQRLTAAKDTEKAFKDAAKSAEDTADSLRKALESTPGLFGVSDVTQQQLDLAKGGVPQNFADDFLRQLKDEVLNGVDREGVSIEQGREALARIGITAADDPKVVLQQLEEAWNNSSLFAAKENLDLINKDAVEQNKRLQDQMAEGRNNIFEFFGLAIEDATEAISGGGGGGAAASVPLTDEQINGIVNGVGAAVVATADAAIAQIVTGAGGGLGLTKIPSQSEFLNQLLGGTTSARAGGEGGLNINELIGTAITNALGGTGLTGEGAPDINEQLSTILTGAGQSIQDTFVTPLSDAQGPIDNFTVGLDGLTTPLTDTGTAALGFNTSLGGATVGMDGLISPLTSARTELDKLSGSAQAVADKFNAIVKPEPVTPEQAAAAAAVNTPQAFARGTRNYPGGVGIGGEGGGPEMFITPGGRAGLIGMRGAERFTLPAGSVILDAAATRQAMRSQVNTVGGVATSQIISSPSSVDNRVINQNFNLSVNSLQSTGAVVRDFALLRVQAAV